MDQLLGLVKNIVVTTAASLTALISAGSVNQAQELVITPSPQVVVQQDVITRSGEYSHRSYTLKYTINVPENGGEITGFF